MSTLPSRPPPQGGRVKQQNSNEFAYLSQVDENSDISVAPRIVRDMRIMLSKSNIQQKGLVAIWALGMKEENREMLTSSGAGQAILEVMRVYPTDKRLIKLACGALKHLGGNLHALNKMGAADELMKAMNRFPDEVELVNRALNAIKNLGKCKANTETMAESGTVKLIDKIMAHHHKKVEILRSACGALMSFSSNPTIRDILWSDGIGRRVVQALSMFPDNEKLQEDGLGVIWMLGYPHCLFRLGAGDVVLRALNKHKLSPSVTYYGCQIVKNFSLQKSGAIELVETGVAETIMGVLDAQSTNLVVQDSGCLALWALSLAQETKTEMVRRGTASFIVILMNNFAQELKVFCGAVSVLTNLAALENTNRVYFDRTEAGQAVMRGFTIHTESEVAAEKCLFCLRNLFYWDAQGLRNLGVERSVTNALSRYKHNNTIQKKGHEVLKKLHSRDE